MGTILEGKSIGLNTLIIIIFKKTNEAKKESS
jgi:hypothetical protein